MLRLITVRTVGHVIALMLVAMLCGAIANVVRPNRIPWIEDWSSYIEAKAQKEKVTLVTVEQAAHIAALEDSLVLDARPRADYQAGHIRRAKSVPFDSVEEGLTAILPELMPGRLMMTYCSGKNCDESFLLTLYLRQQGFTNVVLFAAGFQPWKDAGYPVESGKP